MHSEAAFASLCGVSPVDASSGRQQRHRLNRGGNRDANSALWRIVMVRMGTDDRTRDYIAGQIARGKTKREAMRNLKRYLARHYWKILTATPPDRPQTRPETRSRNAQQRPLDNKRSIGSRKTPRNPEAGRLPL